MVNSCREIIWGKRATDQLNAAIEYVRQDSIKNAEKVRVALLQKIESLRDFPEKNPADKFKRHNDGSYRAF